jgi:hypothetical protein
MGMTVGTPDVRCPLGVSPTLMVPSAPTAGEGARAPSFAPRCFADGRATVGGGCRVFLIVNEDDGLDQYVV